MAFPVPVASVLTGASTNQLYGWRRTELLEPEVSSERPFLYSFRDLLALRTVVRLRHDTSLQKIRKAFATLTVLDFTDHPSRYDLVLVSDSIAVLDADADPIDLVRAPGQRIANLGEIMRPFTNEDGSQVVDFLKPRKHLAVREQRLGGWPTIDGTRVPFNVVADLMADGTVQPREVRQFYPDVSADAARDAASFARLLTGRRHAEAAAREAAA